ncbi:predicted protein [Verticillium alfalfae VaMs.102]|uniref:Predicted protein n=1 Tax=Verticillium alfalfae (strain VaMs.102 / ATCC MYA-4576 / FGSC 10136) TaxID=526221 RepID=C9SN08_VERA1|nr:predicted protein [Verticillium alfalfae VaMs.102]EEY20173.1 predicted protein [Verticillium alfalfae VaMs.102]
MPVCLNGKADNNDANGLCLDHARGGLQEAKTSAPSSEQHSSFVDEPGKRKDEPQDFGAREANTRLGEQRRLREIYTGASEEFVLESSAPTRSVPDLSTTYSTGLSMGSAQTPLMGDTPRPSGNRIARTMTDAPSDAPANTNLFGSYLSSDGWSDSDSFLDFDDHLRSLEPDGFSLLPRPTGAGDGPPPDDRPEAMSIAPVLNDGAAPPLCPSHGTFLPSHHPRTSRCRGLKGLIRTKKPCLSKSGKRWAYRLEMM